MTTTDGQDRRVIAGRYVLRGLLGQGGMADVELAYDEVLDRQVAVKMLHERYAGDASFIDRFRREAQSAAALNHPNVVGVYDTGADRGRPYIVMEYIAGQTLGEIMKREGVLPRRAAEIAAEAAQALHFAHERGIVHRDVKPGNIMVGEDGRVKVTDFGIARAVNVESVTQTSSIFGTAAYVAPEQAQGQRVDGRTDIYALGCVLFEMLTGRQPFQGDSAVALAFKHVSEAPPQPRSIKPEIPAAMEAVVLKAMAKDPADRYQTGRELADDLSRAIAGQQVSADAAQAYAATQAIPRAAVAAAAHDPTLVASASGYAAPTTPTPRREPDRYVEEPGPSGGRIAAYAFLVVLILALVGIAGYLFLGSTDDEEPVAQVVVPDLVGLDADEAQQQLVALGLQPAFGDPEPHPEAPPRSVLRSDPASGATVDRGSTVTLVTSSGPDSVTIPSVVGLTQAEAEQVLTEAGLAVAPEVIEEPDDEVEAGRVLRTEPAAGLQVSEGDPVTLVISAGEQTFTMPFVEELTEATARQQIQNACDSDEVGLCAVVETQVDPSVEGDGRVIRSIPEAGEEVQIGSRVVIVLSREVTEEPTPPPPPEPTAPPTQPQQTTEPQPEPTATSQPATPAPATPPPDPPDPTPASG